MPSCFALYLHFFFLGGGGDGCKLHMHLVGFEPTTSTTLLLKEVLLKFSMSRTIVSGPAGIFFQEIMGRGWVKGVQSEMDAWVVLGYQEAEITLSLSLSDRQNIA